MTNNTIATNIHSNVLLLICYPPIERRHCFKGHLHQRVKRAGRPRGSRPRVPQSIGLNELCVAVYNAAAPLCLRGGLAAGARRDRSWIDFSAGPAGIASADWLVFIDQWPSAPKRGFPQTETARGPALV